MAVSCVKRVYIRCESLSKFKLNVNTERVCVCMESAKEPWFSSESSTSSRQFICLLQSPGTQFRSCSAQQKAKIRPLKAGGGGRGGGRGVL